MGNYKIMREIVISIITVFVVSTLVYINANSSVNRDEVLLSKTSSTHFKSGISIRDIGDLVIIEQKPSDATVIIDKDDLEDIIVFLNNTNSSE